MPLPVCHVDPNDVEAIFDTARELPLSERAGYLASACAGHDELQRRVEKLLRSYDDPGGFLPDEPARYVTSSGPNEPPQIDRYRLLKRIGEGGCGTVYEAEQEDGVRRRVALKVIKAGMDTASVITRFEAERQALAMMDHPYIAKVFDAGSTDAGRPYFVMELVEGQKITDYCVEHKLSVNDRLHLFLQICDAVQHAHQKGIIHRDLKPSNILVSPSASAAGVNPKIIDFGIAKAIQGKLTDESIHTLQHQFLGTPAYMSPEQADLSPDIDTRTDIYSLGVLLYQLLTRRPPFDNQELLTAGLDQMRRIIREVEPERPSKVDESSRLDPDLDWIVIKCLEKERQRRYETASALAADIERYLKNEPIVARPASNTYRIRKTIRRHRTVSAGIALAFFGIAMGGGVAAWSLSRERAALARSENNLHSALKFVDVVFNQIAPQIEVLTGASVPQKRLGDAGLALLKELRSISAEKPGLEIALARVLLKVSQTQNPGNANPVGDYEEGIRRASEALELLTANPFAIPEGEQVYLRYLATFAKAQCLAALGRFDEALSEWAVSLPLLDQLESIPAYADAARRKRSIVLNNSGYSLVLLGRAKEGIDRYLFPAVYSDSIIHIENNLETAANDELEAAAHARDSLATGYLLLRQFSKMLPETQAAQNVWNFILQRRSKDPGYLAASAESLGQHGLALLHAGSVDTGLADLNEARSRLEALIQIDGANDHFQHSRIVLSALQALAFAHPGETPSVQHPLNIEKAQRFLAETEQFASRAKSRAADRYIQFAREEISDGLKRMSGDKPPP